MATDIIPEFVSKLQGVKNTASGWQAQCPAHDDQTASLSISTGDDGRVLVHCHAGCSTKDVVAAVGSTMADLMPPKETKPRPRMMAAYDYKDESGAVLYQACRYSPKGFKQRATNPSGGWTWSMEGVRRVLYRLPELLAADPSATIFVAEGEKDVDALIKLGLVATCNVGGAGSWKDEYSDVLTGRNVVVLPDNDQKGRDHADHVVRSLQGKAATIKVVALPDLPPKGDVSDWLAAGGTVEKLAELVDASGEPAPSDHSQDDDHHDGGGDDDDDDEKKPNQATILIRLAQASATFWHTPDQDAYATIDVGAHLEHWPIRSKAFRRWLQREYFVSTGKAASAQPTQDALGTLEGMAVFAGDQHDVAIRVAEHEGAVYLDLANDDWQVVEVDASGWRIISDPPVRFRRARAMLPLPTPIDGHVSELRQFINVTDQDWPLVGGWLVAAMMARGPYPVLSFAAEQGSGKSTTARVLRAGIDPNSAPLRAEPRDPRDLMIAANNGWIVALDNLSYLPSWLSDALCRLSTGGGFSTRTLYENDEETIFDATRPAICTAIEDVISRGDLLDRSLVVNLPTIPEHRRRSEADFWRQYHEAAPRIFGGLCTALSVAIKRRPTIKLDSLPRMADFAIVATAAEPALGIADGAFMAAYKGNRDDANVLAIDGSLIGKLVIDIATPGPWQGTASDLLAELDLRAGHKPDKGRPKGWPRNAKAVSGEIKRLAPNLRRAGIEVEDWREPDRKRTRMIKLRTEVDSCVRSVQCVQTPKKQGDSTDATGRTGPIADAPEPPKTSGPDATDAPDAKKHLHSDRGTEAKKWTA